MSLEGIELKVTIYGLRYEYIESEGEGFYLLPGMYLDVEKEEAENLERNGACFILKGNDDATNTERSLSDRTDRVSRTASDVKKFLARGRVRRRHGDRANTEVGNSKGRKTNRKETS